MTPKVTVLEVIGLEPDDEVLVRPLKWDSEEAPPRIFVMPQKKGQPTLALGDRVSAKLLRVNERLYEARLIRRIDERPRRVLGVYHSGPEGGRVVPTDRRNTTPLLVLPANAGGAEPGDLVLAEVAPATRANPERIRVIERIGTSAEPRAISLIALHTHGLPTRFSHAAEREAGQAKPPPLLGREDLRGIPLVTIDGADARDFDDAVFAEPDTDSGNPGGWRLIVAIADVAYSVRPGSALDREAFERGNSCYFPDRVVPMLPEPLSNDVCSLRPHEDRGCLAVHLWIGADGVTRRHRFVRAMMRSAARLTYEQTQAAHDGQRDETTGPLLKVIASLYGVYACLWAARKRRGALDLGIAERHVQLNEAGEVQAMALRERFDSHRLIEELMICANAAAAESLEAARVPFLYRIHAHPTPDKQEVLRASLKELGYSLPPGPLHAEHLAGILKKAEGRLESRLVSEAVLRSQAQAEYAPDNAGHFGLALPRYAHFTSPIRRYADLIVHRALIRAHGLGVGVLDDAAITRFAGITAHITMTERRAAMAERDAIDRYRASFLARQGEKIFNGKISGVTRSGLFVRLDESDAEGFIPASAAPVNAASNTLGSSVRVVVTQADPLTGRTLFTLL